MTQDHVVGQSVANYNAQWGGKQQNGHPKRLGFLISSKSVCPYRHVYLDEHLEEASEESQDDHPEILGEFCE